MVAFSGLFFIHDMESFRWQEASCLEGSAAAAAAAAAGYPIKSNSFDIYKKQHTCEKASIMVISTEHLNRPQNNSARVNGAKSIRLIQSFP